MEKSSAPPEDSYRLHRRFDRMSRLIGEEAMVRLRNSHVMIIGLGGVGSWAAEAIVRSGVGTVSIVDFDEVCITNTNRQLQALGGNTGEKKAQVLADRFKSINPSCDIRPYVEFYNAATSEKLLTPKPDFLIDAIDNITAKCHLIHACRTQGIPLVCSTGSGGRTDPTQVRVIDLAKTERDPLARSVRKILRQQYGFPEKGNFGIHAVISLEEPRDPFPPSYDGPGGFKCLCTTKDNPYNNCDQKNLIMGNASYVTGTFGFTCASVVIEKLLTPNQELVS